MPLTPGTRLGPYEITAPLGAGGMGEVYKAHDTRLNRDVAIKVLPDHLSQSPALRERFEREARAISQLSHPHICVLHDIGKHEGADYLVLEYLEGETLGARLRRGPLSADQILKIGAQIADALDKAHRRGVVHRDLKPDNIMLTKSGVKLLDFGLAKPLASPSGGSNSILATMTHSPLTNEGTLVGTFQYMAPEQLEGKEADARSDVFALGCVLYEMSTGKRAFDGVTPASVIAAIMERPAPSIAGVGPPALDRVLKTCLAKDPDDRWQNVRDLKRELEWIAGTPAEAAAAQTATAHHRFLPWVAAGVLALIAAGSSWIAYRSTRPPELKPLVRLEVDLGHDVLLGAVGGSDVIIAPDGARIAYLSRGHLFTRRLDQPSATELAITQGATSPFFSPDGQWIGFTANAKLRKVSVDGGAEVIVCDAGSSYTGNDWGEDGTIVMALRPSTGLFRVSAAGGVPVPITQLQGEERTHRWPQILPGGKAILFTAQNSIVGYDDASIQVVSLADRYSKTVQRGGTFGRYVAVSGDKGYLTYVNRGTLFAVPFDPVKLETSGSPMPVLAQVSYSSQFGSAKLSFSRTGTLVYRSSNLDTSRVAIQWLGRDGKPQPLLDKPGLFVNPRLSPDGQLLAVRNELHPDSGVWIYDLRRDTLTPLALEWTASHPVWTPDGRYIAYGTSQGIFWMRADGGGKPQPLTQSKETQFPTSFSPDGKQLAYFQYGQQGGPDLWTVSVKYDGEQLKAGTPEVFLQSPAAARDPSFSPDGHWLAYASNESGSYQVYVRAFPDKGGRWQISTTNGTSPIFSPTGKNLFFYDVLDDRVMVASYSAKGDVFLADKPRAWSGQNVALPLNASIFAEYDVAPDGKRIVAGSYTGGSNPTDSSHVIFLEHFIDELQRKVPLVQK